mgnify:CR=1 FL=1
MKFQVLNFAPPKTKQGKSKGPISEIKIVRASGSKFGKESERRERSNKAPVPQDTDIQATGAWSQGSPHKKSTASKNALRNESCDQSSTTEQNIATSSMEQEAVAPTPQPARKKKPDGIVTPQVHFHRYL